MHILLRGGITQRLRIASGLVLFTFATTHFLNHAVGLVHLETMHEVQAWRQVVTRSLPGTIVLALALVTHAQRDRADVHGLRAPALRPRIGADCPPAAPSGSGCRQSSCTIPF